MLFDDAGNILPVKPTHHAANVLNRIGNTPSEKNIAYGAKVTASSYYDDWFKPEYAVDDNNGTLWKARHTNWQGALHHDEWLQIDLGKTQKFSEVWTQFEYATFFYQYKIETSKDGKMWTLFADRTQNTMQGSPYKRQARILNSLSSQVPITRWVKPLATTSVWTSLCAICLVSSRPSGACLSK